MYPIPIEAQKTFAPFLKQTSGCSTPLKMPVVSNPAPKIETQNKNSDIQDKKDKKFKKLKDFLLLGGLIGALGAFVYYKRGMKYIKLGKTNPVLSLDDEKFSKHIKETLYKKETQDELINLREKYIKYSNNFVGKTHNVLVKISKFFKNNFYNY